MKIELLLQSITTGKVHDLSNSVTNLKLSTSMYDQPGKLTFDVLDNTIYASGGIVRLKVDGDGVFYGKIFTTEITEDTYSVTCYDQLRYLKNKDTVPFKNKTADEIFIDVCKRMNLNYKVIDKSSHKLPTKLYDNKSYWEMVTDAIDNTLVSTDKKFFVRDNFGTLEFIDVAKQKTNLIVGSKSLLTSYTYKKDIDEDTFNRVKITRSNKEKGTVDSWIVENSDTEKKWGILQYTKSVDDKVNESQIKELAKLILKVKNREQKTINIDCIGHPMIKAGSGIKLEIDGIIDTWAICNTVDHDFSDGIDMMSCELTI